MGTNLITGGAGKSGAGKSGNGTSNGQDSQGREGGAAIYRSSGSIHIKSVNGGTLTLTGGRGGEGIGYSGQAGGNGGAGITAPLGVVVEGGTSSNIVRITGGAGGNASNAQTNNTGGTGGHGNHGVYSNYGIAVLKNVIITGGAGGNGDNGHHNPTNMFDLVGWNTIGGADGYDVVAQSMDITGGGVTASGGSKGAVGKKGNGDNGHRDDHTTAVGAFRQP